MHAQWGFELLSADDYDAIRELWEEAGLPAKPNGRDSRAQFVAQLNRGMQTVIGARAGGRLIGVVIATHDGRKGWINRLAVHPQFRRQGLALGLIGEAERVLREQGIQVVAALIEGWNTASLALFERAGYSVYRDMYYVTKRDADDV